MTRTTKRWLFATGCGVILLILVGLVAASVFSRRLEPSVREQVMTFLRERFDSDVELASLRIQMPGVWAIRLLVTRGHGAIARIEGSGLVLRHKGRRDLPPMFSIKNFDLALDLGLLSTSPKTIPLVTLDGMELHIPPKGERPDLASNITPGAEAPKLNVIFQQIAIKNAVLVILPRDTAKVPLRFGLHNIQLESVGKNVPMKYHAILTNPKPPGLIQSTGSFGPWQSAEPGDAPLRGDYVFDHADLSVFSGIAGSLRSTGRFEGNLNSVTAHGEASVPDFRLKRANNPLPLTTRFEVLVDGTNGNTILKPVVARLGTTSFTTSGGVIKHDGEPQRTISLNASMPDGSLSDVLRLAMKGSPFMEGRIHLQTKIDIPPLIGKVREKLLLNGVFEVTGGRILRSNLQDQVDALSRRGRGQPKNQTNDEVVSVMAGRFRLANEVLTFEDLSFAVPGAAIDLRGDYDLDQDHIDFHGSLRLQAKVSQTMSGWKRWALKPVDPFFAKNGAGTFLRIKVGGMAKQPTFGLDLGK